MVWRCCIASSMDISILSGVVGEPLVVSARAPLAIYSVNTIARGARKKYIPMNKNHSTQIKPSMIPAVFGSNFVSKEGIVEKYHAGSKALITKPTITIGIHHGFPSRA